MNGPHLMARWNRLGGTTLGRALFSRGLGIVVPYTGTIKPHVLELGPGHARVAMKDRRRVRNHLGSIHAIALLNLGEVSSGLALLAGLPPTMRGIVRGLSIEFLKKARGTLVATCDCTIPESEDSKDHSVIAHIHDQDGDEVARVTALWRVGPQRPPA